ncbi:FkbM family methyltransferase [Selenomonas caprae]|nr:FkbM family methyltransferase [Selenomonas caprae]
MIVPKVIKETYSKMQDDKSKQIYSDRLMYNITEDPSFMNKIIYEIDDYKHLLNVFEKHRHQKVIFFGAGWWSSIPRYALPKFFNVEPLLYVDNYLPAGSKCLGIPVISFDELCNNYKNEFIIITAYGARKEIYNQLMSNGFGDDNILILADIVDKPVYKQYFDCPYFEHEDNEVFIDAGVFDGMSAIRFAEWSNDKYDHIYGFEPNAASYSNCAKIYNTLKNTTLFNKGVWDKNTVLQFRENGPGSKIIEDEKAIGNDTISVASIDDELAGERVTFIKMDVEGAELKGLYGAEKTIRKWMPKLAISVYHKPTDLWEIPNIILSFNADYKFYMRHYFFNDCETILYAF